MFNPVNQQIPKINKVIRIKHSNQPRVRPTMLIGISNYFSITVLHINSLNSPIKRHRTAEWVKKNLVA